MDAQQVIHLQNTQWGERHNAVGKHALAGDVREANTGATVQGPLIARGRRVGILCPII